ncbi:hypothetical protein [Aquimarina rhabdastrellae]
MHLIKNQWYISIIIVFITITNLQAQSNTSLGTIGIVNKSYNTTAIPQYQNPIKLEYHVKDFDSKTYQEYRNQFSEIKKALPLKDTIQKKKLQYITLYIADQVGILEALEQEVNQRVSTYVIEQPNAVIVDAVKWVIPLTDQKQLAQAEALFLQNKYPKQYEISLVKEGKEFYTIPLSKGTVFDVETSGFCWKKDKRGKPKLSALLQQGAKCAKGQEQNALQVIEEQKNKF